MKIISDSCKCSSCLNKYDCKDYAMIVSIQSITRKYLAIGEKDLRIIFQVEHCPNRELRSIR